MAAPRSDSSSNGTAGSRGSYTDSRDGPVVAQVLLAEGQPSPAPHTWLRTMPAAPRDEPPLTHSMGPGSETPSAAAQQVATPMEPPRFQDPLPGVPPPPAPLPHAPAPVQQPIPFPTQQPQQQQQQQPTSLGPPAAAPAPTSAATPPPPRAGTQRWRPPDPPPPPCDSVLFFHGLNGLEAGVERGVVARGACVLFNGASLLLEDPGQAYVLQDSTGGTGGTGSSTGNGSGTGGTGGEAQGEVVVGKAGVAVQEDQPHDSTAKLARSEQIQLAAAGATGTRTMAGAGGVDVGGGDFVAAREGVGAARGLRREGLGGLAHLPPLVDLEAWRRCVTHTAVCVAAIA